MGQEGWVGYKDRSWQTEQGGRQWWARAWQKPLSNRPDFCPASQPSSNSQFVSPIHHELPKRGL